MTIMESSIDGGMTATAARGRGSQSEIGEAGAGSRSKIGGGAGALGACVEGAATGQNRAPCERLH